MSTHCNRVAPYLFASSFLFIFSTRQITGGDASDLAMFRFVSSYRSVEYLRSHWRVEFTVPFSSRTKFSEVVVHSVRPISPRSAWFSSKAPLVCVAFRPHP